MLSAKLNVIKIIILVCNSIDTMFVCNLNGQECCRAKEMLNRTTEVTNNKKHKIASILKTVGIQMYSNFACSYGKST